MAVILENYSKKTKMALDRAYQFNGVKKLKTIYIITLFFLPYSSFRCIF